MGNIQLTNRNPNFVPPERPVVNTEFPSILKERYDRMIASYRRAYLGYVMDSINDWGQDSKEKTNQYHITTNPKECTRYTLISMTRVLLPVNTNAPLFEGPDYKPDTSQKSALIANVRVDVLNYDSVQRGVYTDVLDSHHYKLGVYPQVEPRISYNQKGEIINSEINGHRDVFFIRDGAKEIDNIIKLFGKPQKRCTVVRARADGNITGKRTVPSFEEWKNESIELLIQSNNKGLLGNIPGGTQIYKKFEEVMISLVSQGIYPQSRFDNIGRQEVIELIEKYGNKSRKKTTQKG